MLSLRCMVLILSVIGSSLRSVSAHSRSVNSFKFTRSLTMSSHKFVMDAFALRAFNNKEYTGTQVHYDPVDFEKKVNEYFESGSTPLVDGYAPFCKHLFVPNFAGSLVGTQRSQQKIRPSSE